MKITYDQIQGAMENEDYDMSLVSHDAKLLIAAVNQGIDGHLEAVSSDSSFEWKVDIVAPRLECKIKPKDLAIILRRLSYMCSNDSNEDETNDGVMLATDILNTLNFDVSYGEFEIVSPVDLYI